MKFLCPNCKAKYRIGSEKLVGRQAAKIRCRNCDYRIQIAYRPGSDEYDITATPNSVVPSAPAPRPLKAMPGPPAPGALGAVPRARLAPAPLPLKEEGTGAKKPTTAVPGLPNLGSSKSARGAALLAEGPLGATHLQARRPLAPPPPGVGAPSYGSLGLGPAPFGSGVGAGLSAGASAAVALPPVAAPPVAPQAPKAFVPPPAPVPARSPVAGTQLADQFRQSVQAGVQEELPQEGWFVGVNGVPLGPIPVGDLRELANAGHIDRRSLVWREGQAEWRPLGKFPQLARLLDDGGAVPGMAELENSVPAAPVLPRPNGANGHAATGFDVPRAEASDRPSVWGDLDDEDDDEDEQPTTVKGRVSLPPTGSGGPPSSSASPPSVPAPPAALLQNAPMRAPGMAGVNFGSPPPSPAPAAVPSYNQPLSAPPVTPEGGGPASTISTTPEPVVDDGDANLMRPKGRGRRYLIAVAVILAFALGAILMHLLRSSSEGQSKVLTSEPSRALAPSPEAPVEPAPKPPDEQMPAPDPGVTAAVPVPTAHANTPLQLPKQVVGGPAAVLSPRAPPSQVVTKSAGGGSLLSGLGPSTPGPMAGLKGAGDGHAAGPSLDATAIQRTVRRYSPGVRQNCWQRALNARAPGVPSSAKVTAMITIDAAGHVQAVSVSGAPRGYPGLARCIEGSVKGWQFPRAGGETVTNVPFMFVGQ